MKRVTVESPFSGNVESNIRYLKNCLIDSLSKGESPYASHLFFTQFLDDEIEAERHLGIQAGFAWNSVAEAVVLYVDRGLSRGMVEGLKSAITKEKSIYIRKLYDNTFDIQFESTRDDYDYSKILKHLETMHISIPAEVIITEPEL